MRSTNAYALLCLLSVKPMNGYLMKQWVDKVLSHFWKISYGQIYPIMEKFVKDELVFVEHRESDKGPNSKYYHITKAGLDELKEWLAEDTLDFNHKDEALLKFKFSFLLPLDVVVEKAERALKAQQDIIDEYGKNITEMKKVTDPNREQLMTFLATKKGLYLNEARAKWAEECVQALKWYERKENKKKEQNNEEK